MLTSTGELSLKQWKEVHDFFENGTIKLQDIEPSKLKYDQVQMNGINDTGSIRFIWTRFCSMRTLFRHFLGQTGFLVQRSHSGRSSIIAARTRWNG